MVRLELGASTSIGLYYTRDVLSTEFEVQGPEAIDVIIRRSLPITHHSDDPVYLLVILFQVYRECARHSCQIYNVVLFGREVCQA